MEIWIVWSVLFAMVATACGQCEEEASFEPDGSWGMGNTSNDPSGMPAEEIDRALKFGNDDATIYKELTSGKIQSAEKSIPITFDYAERWKCPFTYHYLYSISGCKIIYPKPLPFYIQCRYKKCQHWGCYEGFCRPSCYRTYPYIITLCWDKNGPIFREYKNIRLPQFCECRRC